MDSKNPMHARIREVWIANLDGWLLAETFEWDEQMDSDDFGPTLINGAIEEGLTPEQAGRHLLVTIFGADYIKEHRHATKEGLPKV